MSKTLHQIRDFHGDDVWRDDEGTVWVRQADIIEAMQALAESRARFGDMEARVVELEAVIQKVRETLTTDRVVMVRRERGYTVEDYSDPLVPVKVIEEVLSDAPSVVLADRDAAVWEQGAEATRRNAIADLHGTNRLRNPYRGDNR